MSSLVAVSNPNMQIVISKYKFHKKMNKETLGEVAYTKASTKKKKK